MNANNPEPRTAILVFSSRGQLVSCSGWSTAGLNQGLSFSEVFPGLAADFESWSRDGDGRASEIDWASGTGAFLHAHALRNPEGTILAWILALTPRSGREGQVDEKMIRMDRLVQIGQLASGIAHEIRNPLAGMHANLQVLNERLPATDKNRQTIEIVLEEIARIESIIRDLLQFARQSTPRLESVDVGTLLEKLHLLTNAHLSKTDVRLQVAPRPDLPLLTADSAQILQVLLNLIHNAADACPTGGIITVNASFHAESGHLRIEVHDSGDGMDAPTLEKIFKPFFTTRTKGLGLGLSVARKIVSAHQGTLHARSLPGEGTTMIVELPVQPDPLPEGPPITTNEVNDYEKSNTYH